MRSGQPRHRTLSTHALLGPGVGEAPLRIRDVLDQVSRPPNGGAPTTPCPRDLEDEHAEGGRDPHLVDMLASRRGFIRDRDGTTTWFEAATSCGDTACPDRTAKVPGIYPLGVTVPESV